MHNLMNQSMCVIKKNKAKILYFPKMISYHKDIYTNQGGEGICCS